MPRWPDKNIDTTEQQIGQTATLEVPVDKPLDQVKRTDQKLESEIVTVQAEGLDNGYAAQLAFMEEPIEVMLHESTNPNDQMLVETWVNGVPQRFIRGEPIVVKRKYVEVLARAKATSITTSVQNDQGAVKNIIKKHTALMYPFSVIRDENPRGGSWLKSVLASA